MLDDEIEKAQRRVVTDAYQMSIGELVNLYREGDLKINPEFQRLFRWDIGQKSKLIESLLLRIPIPSIFVFENDDAKWELIDGLQRISTILEFLGELRDPETEQTLPPVALDSTKYLPSLFGAVWQQSDLVIDITTEHQTPLTLQQQFTIKRSRINVEILKRPSDNATKYDLFQRLNAGGTPANPQELRNCITIMVNPLYANYLTELASNQDFLTVLNITDEQRERQRHLEYVSRFHVYTYIEHDGKLDIEEYIDDGIVRLATNNEVVESRETFDEVFKLLNAAFGSDALRRLDENRPVGRVGLAAFEMIAVGIGSNINFISGLQDPISFVREKIQNLWADPTVPSFFSSGLRGTTRISRTIPFGKNWFSQ